jgi:Mn2+/Fe2+ NRAMP family transporter
MIINPVLIWMTARTGPFSDDDESLQHSFSGTSDHHDSKDSKNKRFVRKSFRIIADAGVAVCMIALLLVMFELVNVAIDTKKSERQISQKIEHIQQMYKSAQSYTK